MSSPALLVGAALVSALLVASAGIPNDTVLANTDGTKRSIKSLGPPSLPAGCLYEGAWRRDGSDVPTGEACLRCTCRLGALTCRRRACAPLPDPPPRRCHLRHRKGACCPELHCPDGVIVMEQGASARADDEEEVVAPASLMHVFPACVEGGSVFAAGSALRAREPCEQCFCLGGARRCVRARCLPPPAGCRARPARGACCPDRYYCRHHDNDTLSSHHVHTHDCRVDNKWVSEGERVVSPTVDVCSQCFCLRGSVQCQPQTCAPPLLGCTPLLRTGDCCAHHYRCEHKQHGSHMLTLSSNALSSTRNDDRSFHNSKSNKLETTTKNTLANIYTASNTPNATAKNHFVSTTKVKRKTSDPPPELSTVGQNTTIAPTSALTTTEKPITVTELISTTTYRKIATTENTLPTTQSTTQISTTDFTTEVTSTEQPEGSVRITVNGTINCTAELSSTSLPLNMTFNNTEKINQESHPRVPLIDVSNLEDHTFSANDIITDRTVNGGFDENESFVINVTSSLNANTNHSHSPTKLSPHPVSMAAPTVGAETNSSKKTKGDYVYDYTEPTLPPSLPNLKIIPFVAADAVVEDSHPKKTPTYPLLEREDKFPVYYPNIDTKESAYVTRRDDIYRSTQYPVFITDKPDHEQYPSLMPDVDLTNTGYSNIHTDEESSVNEYTISTDLNNHAPDVSSATQSPLATTTFKLKAPAVNLFSPPLETEGGFIPKGPTGLIEEYFAVYPSTPSGPAVPHLTTSMQLDIKKGECESSDGRLVPEGASIALACSECTCSWGELHCTPRACPTPSGCQRRPVSNIAADLCCGELICDKGNKTKQVPKVSTPKANVTEWSELKLTTEPYIQIDESTKMNTQVFTPNNIVKTDFKKEDNLTELHVSPTNYTKSNNVSNISTATERLSTNPITTTAVSYTSATETSNQSLEYEEEEDEGFSFGSVLKLLLSDSYDTTTTAPKRIPSTTKVPTPAKTTTMTRRPRPTLPPVQPSKPSASPFRPLPIHSYTPSKTYQNPINRIDHLVLGEATAIKKTTPRPVPTTTLVSLATKRTTNRPSSPRVVAKPTELTIEEGYSTQDSSRPPGSLPGLGPGLLKLAGCNIYGMMYRVGRIITELSTPCQECWCTELGVQCKQLQCR